METGAYNTVPLESKKKNQRGSVARQRKKRVENQQPRRRQRENFGTEKKRERPRKAKQILEKEI